MTLCILLLSFATCLRTLACIIGFALSFGFRGTERVSGGGPLRVTGSATGAGGAGQGFYVLYLRSHGSSLYVRTEQLTRELIAICNGKSCLDGRGASFCLSQVPDFATELVARIRRLPCWGVHVRSLAGRCWSVYCSVELAGQCWGVHCPVESTGANLSEVFREAANCVLLACAPGWDYMLEIYMIGSCVLFAFPNYDML